MEGDALLLVEAESSIDEEEDAEGCAPYVQFCAFDGDMLRCEVSSNAYLTSDHLLDQAKVKRLEELGWSAPAQGRDDEDLSAGSTNFYLDLARNHADELAFMTVKALRDVFSVVHPVFLSVDKLAQDDEAAPDLGAPTPSNPQPSPDPDEPIAVYPKGREHLQALVDDALTPFLGRPPDHDEDGDIPVVRDGSLVFVMVLEGAPAIQLFAPLVCELTQPERAAFEVSVLNRDLSFIKFVATGDQVVAYLYLPAWPFAPEQLRMMLAIMTEKVDEVAGDLVARIGGRRAMESAPEADSPLDEAADLDDMDDPDDIDDPDESTLHPALMTLLQLDAESPGSVDPELAASVCGMDRDLILGLITAQGAQEIAWRQARDQALLAGDPDEADVCDHEMQHAARTTSLLRGALRVVVERELGQSSRESVCHETEPRRSR